MKLIVGLGNSGKKYENTRHNVGFLIMSNVKCQMSNQIQNPNVKCQNFKTNQKFNAEIIKGEYNGEEILLVKPHTYMNNSGEAVKKIMDYYKIGSDNLWVVCDDIDLELGQIRIRVEGSSGGHKGLQSIINQVGNNQFVRFRIGIGSNRKVTSYKLQVTSIDIPAEDYVLQKFPKEDTKILEQVIDKCATIILESLDRGVKEETMKISNSSIRAVGSTSQRG